jgi:hypothetical protein
VRLFVAAVVAVSLLSGCGPKSAAPAASPTPTVTGLAAMSASEIVETSIAALKKAGSYRIKGDLVVEGLDVIVDIKVQASDAVADLNLGEFGSATVINVGGLTYLRGDDTFWRKGGAPAATVTARKGKWMKVKNGDRNDLLDFNVLTDPEKLFELEGVDKLVVSDSASLAGVPAIVLKDESGMGRFYVAAQGEPYPLRLNATVFGKLDFSEFGSTFDIQAPPADKVVSG